MENIYGVIASILGVVGAATYIFDTYRRKTLPHRFAWLIFLIISVISFSSQFALGAKASLYYAGWFVCNNIIIFTLSLRKNGGYGNFTASNFIGLSLAILGIILWVILSSPLAALISVLIAEVIGVSMVIIKSYQHPQTETIAMWALGIIASGLNILAVGKLDYSLLAFPIYLFIASIGIVLAILLGRVKSNKGV
ncbi:MAG: hypothetical protein Q7S34_00480 [bacterium]|nr:hypothetical protein [bacterium]